MLVNTNYADVAGGQFTKIECADPANLTSDEIIASGYPQWGDGSLSEQMVDAVLVRKATYKGNDYFATFKVLVKSGYEIFVIGITDVLECIGVSSQGYRPIIDLTSGQTVITVFDNSSPTNVEWYWCPLTKMFSVN